MIDSPAKEAYTRFRFKQRVCFKKCGLWEGKGGFCPAKKDNINYCLSLEKAGEENQTYRNLQNVVEWMEIFAEESGLIMFKPSEIVIDKVKVLLEKSNLDCYAIAEKLIGEANEESKRTNG
ncbi:MAG: hypothetical protein AABY07_00310 [Nanoarchaeota archaeon]